MYRKICLLILPVLILACFQQNQKVVLVTGHRGASGLAPENTISALVAAINLGSDFAEIDVQESRDGHIILLHDSTLMRVAGINKNIWDQDYADLREVDAGSWFDTKFKGEPIPTLENVIDSLKGKMKLNIELKMYGHQQKLVERVLEILEEKEFYSDCIITSFDFSAINRIRKLNNKIKVGYILSNIPEEIDVFSADVDLLSVKYKIVDKEFVRKAHANNKDVHVYTVNEPEEMKRLIKLKVDSIITDRPDVLIDLLKSL